jgi:hypothetical protein
MRRVLAASCLLALGGGYAYSQAYNTIGGYGVSPGMQYNAAKPTLTEGAIRPFRSDIKGRAITTVEKRDTYSAAISGLVLAAAATDISCLSGSATKDLVLKQVDFSGTATSNTAVDMLLIKRSSANTGGTSTALTDVPNDSANPAGTATVMAYTANPTVGTAVGTVEAIKFTMAAATSQVYERTRHYGIEEDQGIVLHGVNESVCLNFNGQTISGAALSVTMEWREIPQ